MKLDQDEDTECNIAAVKAAQKACNPNALVQMEATNRNAGYAQLFNLACGKIASGQFSESLNLLERSRGMNRLVLVLLMYSIFIKLSVAAQTLTLRRNAFK
jgi:ATP/ADP translocase